MECKFKVGDRVLITKPKVEEGNANFFNQLGFVTTINEKGQQTWVAKMHIYDGIITRISEINSCNTYRIEDIDRWYFHEDWISYADEKKPSKDTLEEGYTKNEDGFITKEENWDKWLC